MTETRPFNSQPRILLVPDLPNWIFNRHAITLQKLLSDDFSIDICFRDQTFSEEEYDLIYPLEFDMVPLERIQNPQKYITGIRSFNSWSNHEFLPLIKTLSEKFLRVHVVSKKLYNIFSPYLPDVMYVTHGVDTDLFCPQIPVSNSTGNIRVGWSGNRRNPVKGFEEFIKPLENIPGVELVYCGFADKNYPLDEMPNFYNHIDAFISASSYEGNNNALLEAASMERAIITTDNGTVSEYLENGKSAIIVKRDLNQITAAVEKLRDDPTQRIALGKSARQAVIDNGWDWKICSEDYRQFFWEAINSQKITTQKQNLKWDTLDHRHLAHVIQGQWDLERELRRGLAGTVFQLTNGKEIFQTLEEKTNWIKELETYRDMLESQRDSLEEQLNQVRAENLLLQEAVNSRSFRLIQNIKNNSIVRAILPLIRVLAKRVYQAKRDIKSFLIQTNNTTKINLSKLQVPTGYVRILLSGEKNIRSQGTEVWLLDISMQSKDESKLFHTLKPDHGWEILPSQYTPSGLTVHSSKTGKLDFPATGVNGLLFQTDPWGGYVTLIFNHKIWQVDLFSEKPGKVFIDLKTQIANYEPTLEKDSKKKSKITDFGKALHSSTDHFSSQELEWTNHIQKTQKPVSIIHPDWLGIRSAAKQLFSEVFELPDSITESSARHYARLFIESKCPALVVHGFPISYARLLKEIHSLNPDLPIYNIWHGSFLQSGEDYNWTSFKLVKQLCHEGVITKWGFVKKGMAEIMANQRLRTGFVMNYIGRLPSVASPVRDDGPNICTWISTNELKKFPYVMLAATSMIPNAKAFVAGHIPTTDRTEEFNRIMGIKRQTKLGLIPQKDMARVLSEMHLNLYIHFSECTPMVPLESLSVGTPCLLGPTSHLFEDDDFLHSRLVVNYPERAEIIAKYIQQALGEREAIVKAYIAYAPMYNLKARQTLMEFLDGLEV